MIDAHFGWFRVIVGDVLSDLLLLRALLLCQLVSQLSERDLSIRVILVIFG